MTYGLTNYRIMNASIVGHGIHMRRLSSLLYVAESNAIQ